MVPVHRRAILLARARANRRRHLRALPNVVGTMLGDKLVDGVPNGETAVVVAVSRKMARSRLARDQLVPSHIRVGRTNVPVDVIELAAFVPQAFLRPLVCSDGRTSATVSCVAMSPTGPVGVTCAHALRGLDRDVFTPGAVGLWSPQSMSFVPVGQSAAAVHARGLGIPGDYGFSDIGTFSLDTTEARALVARSHPMELWSGGESAGRLSAESIRGPLAGRVHAVLAEMLGGFCDIVVRVDDGGTVAGDSGLLWRTERGAGLAIHALGSLGPPGRPSEFSGCMLANRVTRLLGVQLLA
jgi:hypothetical protein